MTSSNDIMWKPCDFWLRLAMMQGRKRVGTKSSLHTNTLPRRKLPFTVPSFFTFCCMLQWPAGPYYLHVHKHLALNPTNWTQPISDWEAEFLQAPSLSFDESKQLSLASLRLHTDCVFPLESIFKIPAEWLKPLAPVSWKDRIYVMNLKHHNLFQSLNDHLELSWTFKYYVVA